MGTFINAFLGVLTLNDFFAYPLGFSLCVACVGLVCKMFNYKVGGGR